MFDYEFQKQLVVTVSSTVICLIAVLGMLDFTHTMLKGIYRLGKSGIAKLREKGYLK